MIDEAKANKEMTRGVRAQRLLEDELIKEAFSNLEASYIGAWRGTGIHDQAGREKLFLAINVVGKVKQHLESVVASGNLAKKELADLAKLADRKRFGII